ncbi:MAG: hypothetical protein R3C10_24745 [Pirellulales bacterium]
MSRIRLRSPEQPWLVRLLLGTYEFCASLKLAVFLILCSALVLGVATFVESRYGLRAVHFGIYGTWWFGLLNALLAVNIFCAAAIRYPWKRYQTGFVITHIGLLTLLVGCFMSRTGGIDAQMPIWEDGTNSIATEDEQHFLVSVHPHTDDDVEKAHDGRPAESYRVPFTAGPFNWDQLSEMPVVPWKFAHRDHGTLFDHEGIKLEVLDYYADSEEIDVPRITLKLSMPAMSRTDQETGKQVETPETFIPVELTAERPNLSMVATQRRDRQSVGGGSIVFWAAENANETAAFLDSRPEGELGESGQVVLYVDGQAQRISVADHLEGDPVPLGDSGLAVSIDKLHRSDDGQGASLAAVELTIRPADDNAASDNAKSDDEKSADADTLAVEKDAVGGGDDGERMLLIADRPELNQQARGWACTARSGSITARSARRTRCGPARRGST